MSAEMAKQYDPREVEDKIYQKWLDGNYFHAIINKNETPYTIVIPPPNITGQLHMGHALDNTMQDIIIRWRRMQGYCTLWLPGTDHASIATEVKIVKSMAEEGLTKADIGREGFLERAWKWRETYGGKIVSQLKKLGSSCDWERERFTLDDGCNKSVIEVFNRLYEKGLIYRGERIINWCPVCGTSLSDAEVEFDEKDGHFWHLKYPLTDGSGYLEVATTRPETMLGDTAVAVHPDDERYQKYIGKMVTLPLMNREIPVVADTYVEPEFGTGVVKITPAHDPNDFEVGSRHDLPIINVMNEDASINENGGKYQGLSRGDARKAIVADLKSAGLLTKIEPISHNVGACYRCHTVVEPRVSIQWFVKMKPLAEPAINAIKSGKTRFVPDRFSKIYLGWMENIRDWCISRQLWWGHRIPAWYCEDCGEITVSRDVPGSCSKCGSASIKQDEDTLDTWFSSALWPFSTLGWPDQTDDLKYFYPTNTLVTAYDIIFFWVARMIFSGIEQMGEVPFDTVFIHGLVRDEQGRKMSKSLGNGVDPLEIIEKYGADSLRFSLTTGVSPGNDMRFSEKKVESCRNFANKLWNAARFVLMNVEDGDKPEIPSNLNIEDKWILHELSRVTAEITENLGKFELGLAVQKIYDFIWDCYCDWYIELCKIRLNQGGESAKEARGLLLYVLDSILRLLHPFMPFVTEELYQSIPHANPEQDVLMIRGWPNDKFDFASESEEMTRIMAAVKAIRIRRAEMNVPPSKKASVFIETNHAGTFEHGRAFIERLASASSVEVGESFDKPDAVVIISDGAKILIPMDELVDREKELARMKTELEKAEKDITMLEGKLSNENFVSKAPPQVIDAERQKLAKAKDRRDLALAGIEKMG